MSKSGLEACALADRPKAGRSARWMSPIPGVSAAAAAASENSPGCRRSPYGRTYPGEAGCNGSRRGRRPERCRPETGASGVCGGTGPQMNPRR